MVYAGKSNFPAKSRLNRNLRRIPRLHLPDGPLRFISSIDMRFLKLSPFLIASLLTPLLPAQTVAPAPPAGDIVVLHDVVTGKGGNRDLHAEIAYPKNATKPMPAVIFIHGGGWIGGSYKGAPIQALARAGFFAASIEYRLSNEAKWPAQIEDCKLGVRWLRANAATYGVDPNRIGVWGESAGGHLVACLGTMADEKELEGTGGWPGASSAVQAVVDYYGPTDFFDKGDYSPQAMDLTQRLFGLPHDVNPELWKSGSPLAFVKAGDPPMLIIHGDADTLVPIAQSIVFDAALTKAGVPHQFVTVKNAGHGFSAAPGTTIDPSRDEINRITLAFLNKYLKPTP
jgi:acetyl esterase/lipase